MGHLQPQRKVRRTSPVLIISIQTSWWRIFTFLYSVKASLTCHGRSLRQPTHRIMAPSDEPAPKRRKVRKGTHSCWECRQRKVKCTFSSLDDAICITCHRRGTKCTSQVVLDGPKMAESDTGDVEQDAAINTRPVGESGVHSQPDATVGCLPTPFSIHPTPASSVHGKVSQHLHIHGHILMT